MDIIASEVSMIRDIREREIQIYTDAGRICRPLLIVENQKLLLKKSHIDSLKEREINNYSWQELVMEGVIEYIDTLEEETVMVAMIPEDLEVEYYYNVSNTGRGRSRIRPHVYAQCVLGLRKNQNCTESLHQNGTFNDISFMFVLI